MSLEEFEDKLGGAMEIALAGGVDLDDIDNALEDRQKRLEEVRLMRGEA